MKKLTLCATTLVATLFMAGCTNSKGFFSAASDVIYAVTGVPGKQHKAGGSGNTASVTVVQKEAQAYARQLFK